MFCQQHKSLFYLIKETYLRKCPFFLKKKKGKIKCNGSNMSVKSWNNAMFIAAEWNDVPVVSEIGFWELSVPMVSF